MGWVLVILVCVTAPLVNRLILMGDKGIRGSFVDVRGVLADVSVAALALGLVGALLLLRRVWHVSLRWRLSSRWCSSASRCSSSYRCSIRYTRSVTPAFSRIPRSSEGSVRHMQHPVLFVLMITSSIIAVALAYAPTGQWWWSGLGWVFAASVLGQVVLPISHEHDEWRQRHALHANLSVLRVSSDGSTARTISSDVREVFRSNLHGDRWIGPIDGSPNVILIMIEAASGAYLPSVCRR